jgi:hypothetical protein
VSTDPTEAARRALIATGQPARDLAADKGQRWTTDELTRDFEVKGFAAPFVVAVRRSDGKLGSLQFARGEDGTRYYFGFEEDT